LINKKEMDARINQQIIILDGSMGTFLQEKGMPDGVSPELWCLENPDILQQIHAQYQMAGADIVYTCTLGANPYKLSLYGNCNARQINRSLALLAKETVGKNTLVAGDIGPTGYFIEPFGPVSFEEAVSAFKEQMQGLIEGGVDLFIIETMLDIQEARAALIAAKEISDLFTMVTMTFEKSGYTLNGTDPTTALITLQSLGADAVGCNCSTGPLEMISLIKQMKPYAHVPLVAKPNAGFPKLVSGRTVFDMSPEEFASYGSDFISAGVNILGGCCGTYPAHIQALKKAITGLELVAPVRDSIAALSSARKNVVLEKTGPLVIIGERINPTGKKDLQHELSQKKMSLVRKFAKEQEHQGACLLDVNVGVPGLDEIKTITSVISFLSSASDLPLVIDSTDADAVEAALRLYPGRALINSISGEEKKQKPLLDMASKYGAMFILLPLSGTEIPQTSHERTRIIETVFERARVHGFSKEDIIADALTMTVSADQGAALETLRTIRWCTQEFGLRTVVGLSNVSFGLPQRKWINTAFLAMAVSHGLTLAIANPASDEFTNIKLSADVLCGRDREAQAFVSYFTKEESIDIQRSVNEALSVESRLQESVLEGNREDIIGIIDKALAEQIEPHTLVNEFLIPAIRKVGDLYDKRVYFLPQLIASAETMKKAFEYLEPYLMKDSVSMGAKKKILLATVQGDIHDIGKNIVALMLKNHGFDIIDLGKDVSAERIIEAIQAHGSHLVGLSALMTTTMVNMREVIELAKGKGLECTFLVGGAVVTEAYANSIGAMYAKDGVAAVRVAEEIMKEID